MFTLLADLYQPIEMKYTMITKAYYIIYKAPTLFRSE